MVDRWTVRACPEGHGLTGPNAERCPVCFRDLTDKFEVVRAVGARGTDPDTSKLAALRQEPRSGTQRARILHALLHYGPMTARKVSETTGISGAWKRLSELKQGGHIVEHGEEFDQETGTEVTVYAVATRTASYQDVDAED